MQIVLRISLLSGLFYQVSLTKNDVVLGKCLYILTKWANLLGDELIAS